MYFLFYVPVRVTTCFCVSVVAVAVGATRGPLLFSLCNLHPYYVLQQYLVLIPGVAPGTGTWYTMLDLFQPWSVVRVYRVVSDIFLACLRDPEIYQVLYTR